MYLPFLPVCTVILFCDDASQHAVAIFRTINLLINISHLQDVCVCAQACVAIMVKTGIINMLQRCLVVGK